MLIFGHLGITLGVAVAADFLTSRVAGRCCLTGRQNDEMMQFVTTKNNHRRDLLSAIFDLRFWALGSLLPDIIDKPVGHFLFKETFHYNGRIFSHTLLLVILLMATAFFLPRLKARGWLIALSAGVLMHLILDYMWLTPQTLFWPLLGWAFPYSVESDWVGTMLRVLTHNPEAFLPELAGVAIIGILAFFIIRHKGLKQIIKNGSWR